MKSSGTQQRSDAKGFAWKWAFAAGLLAGLLVLLVTRIAYYDLMGYQPEMHPGIAFVFFPIVYVILCIGSFPIEFLLRRTWYKPDRWTVSLLIGACYALLLTWWAFPDHWYMIVVLNPFVWRWVIAKARPTRTT